MARQMARRTFPLALILLGVGCSAPSKPSDKPEESPGPANSTATTIARDSTSARSWSSHAEDPSTLVFDNGDTLRTGIPGVNLITKFQVPQGRAWFLFSGRANTSKTAERTLFVLSPGDSSAGEAIAQPWHMPGTLRDLKNKENYYEAEVFAGEVLRDTFGVIWYERYLLPDGTWRLNTTLLDLNGPTPDTLVLFGHGRKSSTIKLAFSGKCQVLDTLEQHFAP